MAKAQGQGWEHCLHTEATAVAGVEPSEQGEGDGGGAHSGRGRPFGVYPHGSQRSYLCIVSSS